MAPVQGVSCAFANVSGAAGKEMLIMKTGSTGIKVVTATLALTLLLVGGCTVGPDYEQPEFQLPDAWSRGMARGGHGGRFVFCHGHVSCLMPLCTGRDPRPGSGLEDVP